MNLQWILLTGFACFLSFSNFAQAQSLTETEIKTPFVTPACSAESGDLGQLKLNIEHWSVVDSGDQLVVSVKSSLSICALDADKQFAWLTVNPYEGFQVQYYDDKTNSIKSRRAFIDPAKPFNRMGLSSMNNPEDGNGKTSSTKMAAGAVNTFAGVLVINKSDVLSAQDLRKLAAGEKIRKIIELYHLANLTTEWNGETIQFGDLSIGGRNLILYFKKTVSLQN